MINVPPIPRKDEIPGKTWRLGSYFGRLRQLLRNRWLGRQKKAFWSRNQLLSTEDTHATITEAILSGKPLAVGRLGGVEASIIMWARGLPAEGWKLHLKFWFSETANGATNAGVRPRNKKSYREFARIAWEALENLDLHGVWSVGYEAVCLRFLKRRGLFDGEVIAPGGDDPNHWMLALQGRRVLVVSPFSETITRQIPNLDRVWPKHSWSPKIDFEIVPFPYLIDEGCPETWWQVYERIGRVVSRGNYDVALFGCGGLGLLFADLAKKSGRVGIQLGGQLQLLFGIYGKRHLEQEWHRKHINDAWVRPDDREIPKSAQRVEGGCYW
jgi:hypothetical protein